MFMCDFSPPRTPSANWPDEALSLNSDLICVPHLAPHPTRPDAVTAAHLIRDRTGGRGSLQLCHPGCKEIGSLGAAW